MAAEGIRMNPTPPGWAESALRAFLRPDDFESVSGDLLEEYRETIHPVRGQAAADAWYAKQVLGFVMRSVRVWALLFAAAFITRTALDWLIPPVEFHARATVSTSLGIGLLLATGIWAAMRSGSLVAGTLAGIAATAIGALISIAGAAGLLAVWHDPHTMAAIRASGGLTEVFELPIMLILPGALLGTVGGALGVALKRFHSV
jgi:hypothetical protein